MKKTIALSFLMLVLFSLSAGSLYVGAGGGVGANAVIRGENYKLYEYDSASGYNMKVPVVYEINGWAGLESGLTLSGKNYILQRDYRNMAIEDFSVANVFLEIPLLFRASTPTYSGFALFATAGGYLGYWIWGREKGKVMGMALEKTSDIDQDKDLSTKNRFEAGISVSGGCYLDFSRLRIQFAASYALSLTDMNLPQKKGGYPLYNSTFTVDFALMWRIN